MRVGRSCTADEVVDVIAGLVALRGAPVHLRMDNGPEMIAWALRDYCRLAGTRTTYIEPGSPLGEPLRGVLQQPVPAMNTSTSRSSLPCTKPRSSPRPGEPSTTPTGRTPRGETSPPPSTQPTGPAQPMKHSHNGWTTSWRPASPTRVPRHGVADLADTCQ